MKTEERKKATADKLAAMRKTRTKDANNTVTDMPLLEGDVVTFKVPEDGCAGDLYKVINNAGVEYDAILDSKGRPVSVKALVGRRGNGIDTQGDTRDERCNSLLALLDEKSELSYKVVSIRTLPSTRKEWNDQRIINWGA